MSEIMIKHDNFYIYDNELHVKTNNLSVELTKIIEQVPLNSPYLLHFPEFIVSNCKKIQKLNESYLKEYNISFPIKNSISLNSYYNFIRDENNIGLDEVAKNTPVIVLQKISEIFNYNYGFFSSKKVVVKNLSSKDLKDLKKIKHQIDLTVIIDDVDILYDFIELKDLILKYNIKIYLTFKLMDFTNKVFNGFDLLDLSSIYSLLKNERLDNLIDGLSFDFSLHRNYLDISVFKKNIVLLSRVISSLEFNNIFFTGINLSIEEEKEYLIFVELLSNMLYTTNENISNDQFSLIYDIDFLINKSSMICVGEINKKRTLDFNPDQKETDAKLKNHLSYYTTVGAKKDISSLYDDLHNLNKLYELGYITLESRNNVEFEILTYLKSNLTGRNDEILYFEKYNINYRLQNNTELESNLFSIESNKTNNLEKIKINTFFKENNSNNIHKKYNLITTSVTDTIHTIEFLLGTKSNNIFDVNNHILPIIEYIFKSNAVTIEKKQRI